MFLSDAYVCPFTPFEKITIVSEELTTMYAVTNIHSFMFR